MFYMLQQLTVIKTQRDKGGKVRKLLGYPCFINKAGNKNKIIMSKFKRNHHSKYDRTDFAVQSDPIQFPSEEQKSQLITKQEKSCISIAPFRTHKSTAPKHLKLSTNIINITKDMVEATPGGASISPDYIYSLQEELQTLKEKIKAMENDAYGTNAKRTFDEELYSSFSSHKNSNMEKSKTIETRRSLCGRIYNRGKTPQSQSKSSRYSNKLQESTNYKWRQNAEDIEVFDLQNYSKEMSNQKQQKEAQNISKTSTSYRLREPKRRNVSHYTSDIIDKKGKLDFSFNDPPQPKEDVKPKQLQQHQKQVFSFNPQWQITDINDDFRDKISKKLQIPQKFPLKVPQKTDYLQQYQQISKNIYALFNIDIDKCKDKLIIRRFRNGVYFELKPNKNIVWYFDGIFYFGEWETQLPSQGDKNGFGFEYFPGKYYYLGEFKNGMRHGQGTIKIVNPDLPNLPDFTAYDGEWVNGKPHGFGRQIDENNNKYIGQFQESQKTGKAVFLNKDGLCYQGQVKNGLKHGYGLEKLINGDTYIGNFVDGKFQGSGTYTWKNGSVYEGQFDKGKRQGKGRWKNYNGDEFYGQYSNDIKNGWGKFIWANGEIYQGQFKNDLRNGEGTYRHPNGKMGKFFWIDGQIDHRLYTKQEQQYRCRRMSK